MNLDLTGKTAVVFGSTQGIGKAAAEELAKMGANLILVSRNETKLKAVIAGLPSSEKHTYLAVDFSNPNDLETKLKAFIADKEVNILVNNTGGPAGGPVNVADTSEFIAAFNQHLICNHILVQAVRDKMKAAGYGRIINVISTSVAWSVGAMLVHMTGALPSGC